MFGQYISTKTARSMLAAIQEAIKDIPEDSKILIATENTVFKDVKRIKILCVKESGEYDN